MERFAEITAKYYYSFQLSLFADLVWYTGVNEPITLVEQIAQQSALAGCPAKCWGHQVANYVVDILNLRLFDWGASYVLFAGRLVRVLGVSPLFSLESVLCSWVKQVERLLPARDIVGNAAEIASRAYADVEATAAPWHHSSAPLGYLFHGSRCLTDTGASGIETSDYFPAKVAESPERDSQCCSVTELARRLRTVRCSDITPIVKRSHCIPWVDEMERLRSRRVVEELSGALHPCAHYSAAAGLTGR